MADLTFVSKTAALVDSSGVAIGENNPMPIAPVDGGRSAFGEFRVVEPRPVIQALFPYNLNTAIVTGTTANGGTADQNAGFARCQTGTASNGSAQIVTKNTLRYIPGQSITPRFTAIFTAGVANSRQEIGFGDANDGYFFGYSGATFGLWIRSGGSDTFVAQSSWNVDPLNGSGASGVTLDPTKGNVYQIGIQYLGFGDIFWYIEIASTGKLVLVHRTAYPNANTVPAVTNPTLPLSIKAINIGNTSNLTIKTASMAAYRDGPDPQLGLHGASWNRKTGISTETNLLTLKSAATFASVTNRVRTHLHLLGVSASVDCVFRVVLNPTIGGTPSFSDFDATTSVISLDTAGTTRSGGRVLLAFPVEANNATNIDLGEQAVFLYPGDTLAITAQSVSGNAAAQAGVNWFEEF